MRKMQSYKDYKKKVLEGRPGLRALYAESTLKHEMICKMIDARQKRGMTQSELAKKIGTKQAVISRFESGQSNPTFAFLSKLANAMDRTIVFDVA